MSGSELQSLKDLGSRVKAHPAGPDVLDYSDCEFVSLVDIPMPEPILRMLQRCFRSFGPDKLVIRDRWTATLPNGKVESDVFPHNSTDICCADVAAFTLYQTGKVAHDTRNTKLWDRQDGGFHLAAYWSPKEPTNGRLVKLIRKANKLDKFLVPNNGDPRFNRWKPIDADNWLPGDYMLYSKEEQDLETENHRPGHINVYIGPFREIVDGKLVGPVYHLINGSIGEGGGNAVVRPKSIDGLQWYFDTSQFVWHCRVLAVEALYGEVVGYPVRLASPKPLLEDAGAEPKAGAEKKEPKPDAAALLKREEAEKEARIADLWDDSARGGTGYPLGSNLMFHDGVHLHEGAHLEKAEVVAFAPGQLVMARLGEDSPFGSTSFVLLEHRLDPKTRRFLPPPQKPDDNEDKTQKARREEVEARAKQVYSLSMHLAPKEAYFSKAPPIDGIPALAKNAPAWMRRFWPERVPGPREYFPQTTKIGAILGWGKNREMVALTPANGGRLPSETEKAQCRNVIAGGVEWLAVPQGIARANAEVWSESAPIARIPKDSSLIYLMQDGSTIELKTKWPPGARLRQTPEGKLDVRKVGDDGRHYVAVNVYEKPGIRPRGAGKAIEDPNDGKAHVVGKLDIFLEARGEGANLRLQYAPKAPLTGRPDSPIVLPLTDPSLAGHLRKTDVAYLDLTPTVALSAEEKTQIEDDVLARMSLAKDVMERHSARFSSFYAAKVGPKEDLMLNDEGLAVPNQEILAKRKENVRVIPLYPAITGVGDRRIVNMPSLAKQVDADSPSILCVQPSAEIALSPLEIIDLPHGKRFALFELMLAVSPSTVLVSSDEKMQAEERNKARKQAGVADALLRGETVRFRDLVQNNAIADDERNINTETIGFFGKDEKNGSSFHFEIFSGENLIDPSIKGKPGSLELVPETRFIVLKDTMDDAFTDTFIRRMLDRLAELPSDANIDARALHAALANQGVVKAEEWVQFYKDNFETLSHLITVHQSEWALPLGTIWKAKTSRGRDKSMPGDLEQRSMEALAAFQWWDASLKLPGIDDPKSTFFYHPLRFIEWVKSGIDIVIIGLKEPENAEIDVVLDETTKRLEYSGSVFAFRTSLGEVRQARNVRLRLGEGFQTERREIAPIRIKRGEVTALTLVNPSFKIDVQQDDSSVLFDVGTHRASIGYKHAAYLLADGNRQLVDSGYSHATFRVDIAYNFDPPAKIEIQLKGEGFRIASYAVNGIAMRGEQKSKAGTPPPNPLVLEPEQPSSPREPFTGSRSLSILLDIMVANAPIGKGAFGKPAAAELGVDISGGDLGTKKGSIKRIETREIARSPQGTPSGEDIAKLELYLAQIAAVDGFPCYRVIGSHKREVEIETITVNRKKTKATKRVKKQQITVADEYDGTEIVDKMKNKRMQVVQVDGEYTGELAKALWRFIYTFVHDPKWELGTVSFTDRSGENRATAAKQSLMAIRPGRLFTSEINHFGLLSSLTPEWVRESHPGEHFDENALATLMSRVCAPDEYPVVNAGLLAEIVRAFRMDHVIPKINFKEIASLSAPGREDLKLLNKKWENNWIQMSAILPYDDAIGLMIAAPALREVEGDLQVEMSLPQESAYRFGPSSARTVQMSIRELCKTDKYHELRSHGVINGDPAANTLTIRTAQGRKLGEIVLAGAPDLTAKQSQPLRATALMQIYMSRVVADPSKPESGTLIKHQKGKDKKEIATIDGVRGDAFTVALQKFRATRGIGDDYAEIVKALKAEHDAAK